MISKRLTRALTTYPTPAQWAWCGGISAICAIALLSVGFSTQFFRVTGVHIPWPQVIAVIGITLFAPSLAEEAIFRVLMLPGRHEAAQTRSIMLWGGISVLAFVVYHPLKAPLVSRAQQVVYTDPAFLVCTLILGIACALVYRHTGSIWPSLVLHWLFVVAWLLFLGGYGRLYA